MRNTILTLVLVLAGCGSAPEIAEEFAAADTATDARCDGQTDAGSPVARDTGVRRDSAATDTGDASLLDTATDTRSGDASAASTCAPVPLTDPRLPRPACDVWGGSALWCPASDELAALNAWNAWASSVPREVASQCAPFYVSARNGVAICCHTGTK